jgi:cytochrome c-type biogenesis protein CcmH/NrfF
MRADATAQRTITTLQAKFRSRGVRPTLKTPKPASSGRSAAAPISQLRIFRGRMSALRNLRHFAGSIFVLALAVAPNGRGVDVSEQQARELEAALIAPCCFSQQVSVHQSPAAAEVKQDVRLRLQAGETPEQILAAYVARYGNRVLAQPPAEGVNRLLYVLPPIGLLVTALVVAAAVRRYTAHPSAVATAAPLSASPATENRYHAELDRQLEDLD